MQVCYETKSFISKKTNEPVTFINYYVVIKGIKVYLQPADATARQLLENYIIEQEQNEKK